MFVFSMLFFLMRSMKKTFAFKSNNIVLNWDIRVPDYGKIYIQNPLQKNSIRFTRT